MVTACGGGIQTTGDVTNTIQLVAQNIRFQPDVLMIKANKKATLTFTNLDDERHTFEIEGIEGIGLGILPNGEAILEFTIDQPGTYLIFCGIDDHRERGMVAELTVES
jgi:uncharacterized cupredoxin-like copper-binding protein